MIYDVVGPSFVGLEVDEEPNPQDKKFFDMLKVADTNLWQGYKKMSQLSTTARCLILNLITICLKEVMILFVIW